MKFVQTLSINAARFVIRGYQIFISPLLGAHCRFVPPCSEYANQAVGKFGFVRGTYKSFLRLLRCHPFHSGGHDPVCK